MTQTQNISPAHLRMNQRLQGAVLENRRVPGLYIVYEITAVMTSMEIEMFQFHVVGATKEDGWKVTPDELTLETFNEMQVDKMFVNEYVALEQSYIEKLRRLRIENYHQAYEFTGLTFTDWGFTDVTDYSEAELYRIFSGAIDILHNNDMLLMALETAALRVIQERKANTDGR